MRRISDPKGETMAVIHVLSQHVADMIAAGEVVERPGSVVKELMENSLDAGARSITAEIRRGGATFIRVTDDGCGMAPDDAGNCFLRHATSKLRDEHDLEAIATMGFRGEALAAVSAVSRIELITRREGDSEGTYVLVEGGEILDMHPAGVPKGTSVTVCDLFYNTPARLKFMRSDRAESAWCVQTALRVALGRPDVSVRCIRDGREEFFTPGDGRPVSAVYALLGRETALSMLPAEGESEGVRVSGFVSSPSAGRGNRALQYFFVNGRAVHSLTMQAALEQAYKNTLLTGRFPACVLYITVSPGAVDVNVHPTKDEVKFSAERSIFDAVYYAALGAVHSEEHPPEAVLSPAEPLPAAEEFPGPAPAPGPAAAPERRYAPPPSSRDLSAGLKAPAAGRTAAPAVPDRVPVLRQTPFAPPYGAQAPKAAVPEYDQQDLFGDEHGRQAPAARLVGEVMHTYIVAEQGDEMLLIDKHAAHERINFDRLKAAGRQIMSQTLLEPEIWRAGPDQRELILRRADLLAELGFSLEPFGEEELLVRGVPDTLDPAQTIPALEEIAGSLQRGRADLQRDEILQTISCKAAIKAGWDTDPEEMRVLVEKVASGEIRYCPHGRPVAIRLSRKDLDRQFRRIV